MAREVHERKGNRWAALVAIGTKVVLFVDALARLAKTLRLL